MAGLAFHSVCVCVYRNVAPSVFITSPSLRYKYFFFWSPITSSCGGHLGSLLTLSSESATHAATLVRVSYRHHGFHIIFTLIGNELFESTNSHIWGTNVKTCLQHAYYWPVWMFESISCTPPVWSWCQCVTRMCFMDVSCCFRASRRLTIYSGTARSPASINTRLTHTHNRHSHTCYIQ